MSIIIHGMTMPRFGKCIVITSDGVASKYLDGDVAIYYDARPDKASAAELPPHGRLIDADALRAEHGLGEICENCPVDKRYCQYEMIYTKMDVCGWLDDASTVIPADPEGGADNA